MAGTTDYLLRDLIITLKQKLQAAAATASPEELAYLASAIDKIGGRATVLEVQNMGDNAAQQIVDALNAALASLQATRDAAAGTVNTARDAAVNVVRTTLTPMNMYFLGQL